MTEAPEAPLTFVTVAFESELPLLLLQARSMAHHLDPALVSDVLVIDNTARGMRADYRSRLEGEYGGFGNRLSVLRPTDICQVPAAIGWRQQQVLKLAVAAQVTTAQYVVLDAKNHFVSSPDRGFFRDANGRASGTAYSYESHPLRSGLEHVLSYLGLDAAPHIARFTATVTPFVFDTPVVLDLIAGVETRSGRPFAVEFIENDLLEFFLYTGWVLASGKAIDDFYALDRVSCATVWPRGATLAAVRTAVASTVESHAPVFSVHRTALAALDADATRALARFWTDAHLFASVSDAQAFITVFRAQFARGERRRKAREVGVRVATRLRRLGRA
jgi:hypothetical protein